MSQTGDPVVDRLREATGILMWELGAVQVREDDPFELASGNFSPIYFDCRRVISEPGFMSLFAVAARLHLERAGTDFDVVAGGETAGIPFGAVLATSWAKPMVYIRKKAKGYGAEGRIEGRVPAGSRVLLVEDLITDGGSKLGFLEAIESVGAVIDTVLVLCDRQQGGQRLLADHDVELRAIVDRDTLMKVALDGGLLEADQRKSVETYFSDPAQWHRGRGLPFDAPS